MVEVTASEPQLPVPDAPVSGSGNDHISWWRLFREVGETLVLAVLIFMAVRIVVQNFRVEGQSMEPNLASGQYLLINKALYARIDLDDINRVLPVFNLAPGDDGVRYLFRTPKQGDVVVFRFPQQPERDFIKRVMAVPGDTIEVREGVVSVNGQVVDEPYIARLGNYSFGPTVVPNHQYFVLGDNRPLSYDSRVWGFVPEEYLIGKAWFSYWPASTWGPAPNQSVAAKTAGH
jgi:signal peptidase I